LGPNGAGKTTIMKMLTGYLEPSSGRIRIGGRHMATDRQAIQAGIGYLPENCPIYPDMTVLDYLDYRAVLQGVPAGRRTAAIREAVDRTDLGDKADALVSTLSRGYRQRVGVAQAILHHPNLVILDEPTNGLDPTQILEMRGLVRELAREATVLISTHILGEVQAVCERVLLMRRGRLALDDRLDNLGGTERFVVTVGGGADAALFSGLDGVGGVELREETEDRTRFAVTLEGAGDAVAPALARAVQDRGLSLYALEPEKRTLESVFAEINAVPEEAEE
ncbi:MAG TPA: ABC transporter ATP-binding protein, partial [Gammaproteobacteria bacterium]|nr:ABC transporter ATP-binding protein [Gammaproteobacteria bacterium]